jgi:hypothetical protein
MSTPSGSAAPKSCCPASSREIPPGRTEPPSARGCHVPDLFRPCRSSRLRRLAPSGALQVCCTLLPIMGFATFPVCRVVVRDLPCRRPPRRGRVGEASRCCPVALRGGFQLASVSLPAAVPARPRGVLPALAARLALGSLGPFPMALHPSELSPRQQLCRVNRTFLPHSWRSAVPGRTRFRCCAWSVTRLLARATAVGTLSPLLALAPCRASVLCEQRMSARRGAPVCSTSGCSSADESVALAECCHSTCARCSLGLRPLKACPYGEGVIGAPTGSDA